MTLNDDPTTLPDEKMKSEEEQRVSAMKKLNSVAAYVRTHPVVRTIGTGFLRSIFYYQLLKNPDNLRELMKNKNLRHSIFNYKHRTGYLEGSLIQTALYTPSEGSLVLTDAPAGRFVGYDYLRPSIIPNSETRLKKGRLCTIVDFKRTKLWPKDRYTPIGYADFMRFEDFCNLDMPSLDAVVKQEFVEPTTYREAYKRLGIYDAYALKLEVLNIAGNEVFQVTPKGNGVLYLLPDGGEKKENPKESMEPALSWLPAW